VHIQRRNYTSMPPSHPSSDGPTTRREFEDALGALLRAAHDNGVDVVGGYAYRNDPASDPDWGVEVHEVAKLEPSREIG